MDQQPPQDSPSADAEGNAPRPRHDRGLRRLFSHQRMVADLLRLLPEGLADSLDPSTLRRLPAVLADIQPTFQYALLEVRRFAGGTLALRLQGDAVGVNFAAAQFALESASAEDLPAAMAAVARLLKAEGELGLAESFGMWVEGVLEPKLGVRLPSLMGMMEEPPMLAETLDEWAEEKFQLGRVEGMARGRAEGIEWERALLLRQAQRRFGADVAEALSALIEGMDDPARLAEVGDLVVDCATGRELLDRAGRI